MGRAAETHQLHVVSQMQVHLLAWRVTQPSRSLCSMQAQMLRRQQWHAGACTICSARG